MAGGDFPEVAAQLPGQGVLAQVPPCVAQLSPHRYVEVAGELAGQFVLQRGQLLGRLLVAGGSEVLQKIEVRGRPSELSLVPDPVGPGDGPLQNTGHDGFLLSR